MSKDMEGGNKQRRRLARQAEKDGKRPSEVGLTLGASKQRHRVRRKRGHKERLLAIRRGKQEVTSANRRTEERRVGKEGRTRSGVARIAKGEGGSALG